MAAINTTEATARVPSGRMRRQRIEDLVFRGTTRAFALGVLLLLGAVMVALAIGSLAGDQGLRLRLPVRARRGTRSRTSSARLPAIYGTLVTSLIAMVDRACRWRSASPSS